MSKCIDTCVKCGKEFANSTGIDYRVYCSVLCQFLVMDKICEHGYDSEWCVKCFPEEKDNG